MIELRLRLAAPAAEAEAWRHEHLSDGARLGREFPGVRPASGAADLTVDVGEWDTDRIDLWRFDERCDELTERGAFLLCVHAPSPAMLERATEQVLLRAQRCTPVRNGASRRRGFGELLAAHRALHDATKPSVRADLRHALDTWQWLLRLAPDADLALQTAALLHDIERLDSEAERRIEHEASDYDRVKEAHAARGAERTADLLASLELPRGLRARATRLVASHESPGSAPAMLADEVRLLNDADGLSFFSLNSAGYYDYFGPEQTQEKVRWTLERLSSRALLELCRVRLRSTVARLLAAAQNGTASGGLHAGT